MAEINLQMTQRNAANTDWDNLNPITKAANVKFANGTTVEEHLADYVKQPADGGTTGGTATAYTCSSTPAPTVLSDKIGVVITAHADSGSNPTLNWSTLGAKPIKKPNGNAAVLKNGGIYTLRYNSTTGNFILQGEGSSEVLASDLRVGVTVDGVAGTFTADATSAAGDIGSGKTAYVDGVLVTGTSRNYDVGDRISVDELPVPNTTFIVNKEYFSTIAVLAVLASSDGYFYVLASPTVSSTALIKYDSALNEVWRYAVAVVTETGTMGIAEMANGDIVTQLGYTMYRISSSGSLVWVGYNLSGPNVAKSIFERTTGDILVIYYSGSVTRALIMNSAGTLIITASIETVSNSNAWAGFYVTSQNLLYIAACTSGGYIHTLNSSNVVTKNISFPVNSYKNEFLLDGMDLYCCRADSGSGAYNLYKLAITGVNTFSTTWSIDLKAVAGINVAYLGLAQDADYVYVMLLDFTVLKINKTSGSIEKSMFDPMKTGETGTYRVNGASLLITNGISDILMAGYRTTYSKIMLSEYYPALI